MTKRQKLEQGFERFLPQEFVPYVVDLLLKHPIKFKVVPPRSTKLGDFRAGIGIEKPVITVNGNLNPYAFLITTLHEIAHLHTYLRYNVGVKAHGKEWKFEFQQLLLPLLSAQEVPEELKTCLKNTLKSL